MSSDQTRRGWIKYGAALGGLFTGCSTEPHVQSEDEGINKLGKGVGLYGERSPEQKAARLLGTSKHPEASSSTTPLDSTMGIITPAALHFERHHAGVPALSEKDHELLLHGLVDTPLVFSMADLKRLPSASQTYFLECAGNGGREWSEKVAVDVQSGFGLASCSEWTGVKLSTLLQEAGLKAGAQWFIAEGGDTCKMHRSLPIEKGLKDVLLAYGQNGEALRPEQGYPLRLIVPGWEGNVSVKWLRQIKVVAEPLASREETSKYTDMMPDGKARQYTFAMEAKSVITNPSGGHKLTKRGYVEISGLAWTGKGRIERVEVTTDGGKSWQQAKLQEPRLPMAFTRFRFDFHWSGEEATIASRAVDESGYVQPAREELLAVRGGNSHYHFNGVKLWRIAADGKVTHVEA